MLPTLIISSPLFQFTNETACSSVCESCSVHGFNKKENNLRLCYKISHICCSGIGTRNSGVCSRLVAVLGSNILEIL